MAEKLKRLRVQIIAANVASIRAGKEIVDRDDFGSGDRKHRRTRSINFDLERAVDELDAGDRELVQWMREGLGSFVHSVSLESEVKQLQASIEERAHTVVAQSDPVLTVSAAAAQGWVGDVKIGSGADATTAVAAATADPTFPAGQPVHLVTKVQNAPSHTPISVVWVGPDNQEVRKEINWTRAGEKMLAFTVSDTAAWKSGEYRAELWVADKKVQQAQFGITPMEQTEQDP